MSIESVARALNLSNDRLTVLDRLVLIGIANHDGDGGAWPSIATLCRYTGAQDRSVRRSVARLEEFGYVVRHLNDGGTTKHDARYRPNRYELHLLRPGREDTAVLPQEAQGGPTGPVREDRNDIPGRTEESSEPSSEPSAEPSSLPTLRAESALAKRPEDDADFQTFWEMYGRVGPRSKAWECWLKARKSGASGEDIISGLEKWVAYWKQPGAASVKWPQGWLNDRRWEDEPPTGLLHLQRPTNPRAAAIDKLREMHRQAAAREGR